MLVEDLRVYLPTQELKKREKFLVSKMPSMTSTYNVTDSSKPSDRKSRRKHRRENNADPAPSQSKRSNSLTRQSVRAMLPRSWKDSFRRKQASNAAKDGAGCRSELSTEETAPGVLKVFGNSVTPGAQYKSVLATQSSTSQELIKEALERYDIDRTHAPNFVLCDVIGKLSEETDKVQVQDQMWNEQCVRVMGDHERPLTLQLYWKPVEGYSRRFEIRKRCEIQSHEDTITSGLNANARRMLLAKIKPSALSSDNLYYQIKTAECDAKAALKLATTTEVDLLSNVNPLMNDSAEISHDSTRVRGGVVSSDIPQDCPYLLTVKHGSGADVLVHRLYIGEVTIGKDSSSSVVLGATDVGDRHCILTRKTRHHPGSDWGNSVAYWVAPFGANKVFVNCEEIQRETELKSFDLISIGERYTFIYKNPMDPQNTSEQELLRRLHQSCGSSSETTKMHCLNVSNNENQNDHRSSGLHKYVTVQKKAQAVCQVTSETVDAEMLHESKEVKQWRQRRNSQYEQDKNRLKIRYDKGAIDAVLETILNLPHEEPALFRLTPCFLFCMCVEYSAVKFEQVTTRRTLLKIVKLIQADVWVRFLNFLNSFIPACD